MGCNSIHQVYIADGFDDDCERLINRCTKAGKVTYELFCEIWKEMNFDTLYKGRSSGAEVAELSEELVYTAKQHMLSKTAKFEASVAALFIVYAVIHIQPYRGFASLRLVPEDLPAVARLEARARRARRLDVLYILGALLVQNTEYHAAERERGMECPYRKYFEGYLNINKSTLRTVGIFSHNTEELDLLRDITRLTDEYADFKKMFSNTLNAKNLNYVNHSLPTELDTSLKNIIGGFIEDLNVNDKPNDNPREPCEKSRMQEIKERAMKLSVGKMKHLTGIDERETNTQPQTKTTSDIKSKGGKIKTSNPTKPVSPKKKGALSNSPSSPSSAPSSPSTSKSSPSTSKSSPSTSKTSPSTAKTSPNSKSRNKVTPQTKTKINYRKRRKILNPKRRHRKVKKKSVSESDSESEDSDELNLDDSAGPEAGLPSISKEPEQPVDNNQIVQANIQIDTLPCLIRTEQDGTTFEIEIIDELNPQTATATANENNEIIIVQSKNNDDNSNKNNDKEKFKLPSDVGLKKIEKCDMKKPIMKSKFKRMGILPIANFNEK